MILSPNCCSVTIFEYSSMSRCCCCCLFSILFVFEFLQFLQLHKLHHKIYMHKYILHYSIAQKKQHYTTPHHPTPPHPTDNKLSMTFTANGKNETFAVSLQLCVQWSELSVFAMNSRRRYSIFVCFIYGLEERTHNHKLSLPFAVNVMLNLSLMKEYRERILCMRNQAIIYFAVDVLKFCVGSRDGARGLMTHNVSAASIRYAIQWNRLQLKAGTHEGVCS